MRKAGQQYMRIHSMGQLPVGAVPVAGPAQGPTSPAPRDALRELPRGLYDPDLFVEVPAVYTATVILGPEVGATGPGSVPLRPEMFALRRITWASEFDSPPYQLIPGPAGRQVEIYWGDEFTKFLGNTPTLISALFGDSNGFLDLPGEGILFQGRQTLNVQLKRNMWGATAGVTPADTRWDICFQGVGLLPRNSGGVSGAI
jgi:hypothetical protein